MTTSKGALVPAPPSPRDASVTFRKRSVGNSRQRRRAEAAKGNANALQHGIFARVANAPDVATEIAVQMAARPSLDPLLDLRLVESYALAAVSYRRALEAIDREGMSTTLTSFAARFALLEERQERALTEREVLRQGQLRRGAVIDLSKYVTHPQERP